MAKSPGSQTKIVGVICGNLSYQQQQDKSSYWSVDPTNTGVLWSAIPTSGHDKTTWQTPQPIKTLETAHMTCPHQWKHSKTGHVTSNPCCGLAGWYAHGRVWQLGLTASLEPFCQSRSGPQLNVPQWLGVRLEADACCILDRAAALFSTKIGAHDMTSKLACKSTKPQLDFPKECSTSL